LEACIQAAESEEVTYIVGVASTTGWQPEARSYVEASDAGRSFSHRLVVPCLVDLQEMTLAYNESDSRLALLVSLFAPLLPEEEVERAMDYINRALLVSHGVTVAEICEQSDIAEQYARIAFERLVEQGTHRLEKIPTVGQVLTRAKS
jgi:glutathionyl-hydroquinone reductase